MSIRPLLRPGVGYEIEGEIVNVYRGRDVLRFRGAKVAPFLSRLLATLDGTRTKAEVREALPAIFRSAADQILSALEEKEMVVEGPTRLIPNGIPSSIMRLSQELSSDWENRLEALCSSDIRLEGSKALARKVRKILKKNGAKKIKIISNADHDSIEPLNIRVLTGQSIESQDFAVCVSFDYAGAIVNRELCQKLALSRTDSSSASPLIVDLSIALACFKTIYSLIQADGSAPVTWSSRVTRDCRIVHNNEMIIVTSEKQTQKRNQSISSMQASPPTPVEMAVKTFPLQIGPDKTGYITTIDEGCYDLSAEWRDVNFDEDWDNEIRTLARLIALYWGGAPYAGVSVMGSRTLATCRTHEETVITQAEDSREALKNALEMLAKRLQTFSMLNNSDAERKLDVVRNFAVLTSERRSENIGSMWSNNNFLYEETSSVGDEFISPPSVRTALVHKLPPKTQPSDLDKGGSNLSCFEKLAEIVRHTVLPNRLEVGYDLQISVHRPLPSGGNKHAIRLLVECDLGHGRSIYQVDVMHERLVGTDLQAQVQRDANSVTFHVQIHLDEVLEIYGEFGLCLLLMETGSLRAQIEVLARSLGIPAIRSGESWSRTSRDRVLVLEISTLRFDGKPRNKGVRTEIETDEPPSKRLHAPELDSMIDLMTQNTGRRFSETKVLASGSVVEPFKLTHKRSSNGNAASGRYDLASDRIVADIIRSVSNHQGGPNDMKIDVIMSDHRGNILRRIMGTAEFEDFELSGRSAIAANAALGSNAAVLTIHATDAFAADGCASSYLEAHMAAGEILHALGLAAARHGWYARGYRALSDVTVGATLPLDRRPILQVQIGPRIEPLQFLLV